MISLMYCGSPEQTHDCVLLPLQLAVPDLVEASNEADILVFVIPHQFIGRLCDTMKGKIKSDALGISLIKVFLRIAFFSMKLGSSDLVQSFHNAVPTEPKTSILCHVVFFQFRLRLKQTLVPVNMIIIWLVLLETLSYLVHILLLITELTFGSLNHPLNDLLCNKCVTTLQSILCFKSQLLFCVFLFRVSTRGLMDWSSSLKWSKTN